MSFEEEAADKKYDQLFRLKLNEKLFPLRQITYDRV